MSDYRDRFKGARVLVTGGAGFIGSNLVIRLVELGAQVTVVDSLIPAYGGNLFNLEPVKNRITLNIADVRDQSSMDYLVQNRDYLFNFAGQVAHLDSMTDPFTDLDINARSQLALLEACRRYNRELKILYAGTRGQYGKILHKPVDERHPTNPTDVNGINKLAGEHYHLLYNNVYGIRACSLRLTNTYGPRHQMRTSRQGYLHWFISRAMDGEEITIYQPGDSQRDFVHVDDVVEASLMAMASEKTDGHFFNVGSGEAVTILESAQLIVDTVGSGSVQFIPWPKDKEAIEIGDYICDASLFRETVGWRPRVAFRDGIERTVEYYRRNKQQYW